MRRRGWAGWMTGMALAAATAGPAPEPTMEELVALLGQPVRAPSVAAFLKRYALTPTAVGTERPFYGGECRVSQRVRTMRYGREDFPIEVIVLQRDAEDPAPFVSGLVLELRPGDRIPAYTGLLPGGLRAGESAAAVEARLGRPATRALDSRNSGSLDFPSGRAGRFSLHAEFVENRLCRVRLSAGSRADADGL